MSDKIREEFEAWVEKEAKRRKYAYMDFLLLRDPHSDDYRTTWVDMAWMGWKASRESLVIELPELMVTRPYQTIDRGSANYKAGFNRAVFMSAANVAGAGLKVKS